MTFNLQEAQRIIGATEIVQETYRHILQISIDSRGALNEQTLFIAIKGKRNNGHEYIADAYKKGCRAFVITEEIIYANFPEASFMLVHDAVIALQALARAHRKQFTFPVIGITGSNGKTIVKEWLSFLAGDVFTICKNPKSYNSQVGVPLSVWQLNEKHTLGIFEAGISQPGEMEKLQQIIQPDIAVLTNIGQAHDENFIITDLKISEKIKLFKTASKIIFCNDHPITASIIKNAIPSSANRVTWSKKNNATLLVTKTEQTKSETIIEAIVNQERQKIIIPFRDNASIENAISCWSVLIALGINDETHRDKFLFLQPVEMRLELKQGINNCSVINDSYNSDLSSLSIAIDFLNQQHRNSKKTVILSDILQSGKKKEQLYKEVSHLLQSKGVQRLIGVGQEISSQAESFINIEKQFFQNTNSFISEFRNLDFYNESILLKAARSFEFEKINSLLQNKSHDTQLVINLNHLISNVNYFRNQLHEGTKIMAMVKAQSYGSGSYEIASLLQYHRVNYLAVAYADEGVELRKAGITLPIMVMSPERESFDSILVYQLEPEIYSFKVLKEFLQAANTFSKKEIRIHLKIDTGMHRLGFMPDELHMLINELKKQEHLKVLSVFSHLAASDNPQFDDFTNEQIKTFKKCCEELEEHLGYSFIKHICNSSGISRFKNAHFDMVRLGIGMYGIGTTEAEDQQLLPVCFMKTVVSQLKLIPSGDTVSYNRSGKIDKPTKIAVLPIGYADGFNRKLSNGRGKVWIKGKEANVVGSVCMDMCMVDVSAIDVQEGDEVIIFDNATKIREMAKTIETIPYEILTSISSRVKKVYTQE
jgi:alanine racemase